MLFSRMDTINEMWRVCTLLQLWTKALVIDVSIHKEDNFKPSNYTPRFGAFIHDHLIVNKYLVDSFSSYGVYDTWSMALAKTCVISGSIVSLSFITMNV